MKLVVTAGGSVTWQNTRERAIQSSTFRKGTQDFGAGVENTAECPNCKRVLPTVCMHLDHILPQAKYTRKIFPEGTKFSVYQGHGNGPVARSASYDGLVNGGVAYTAKVAKHKQTSRQKAAFGAGKRVTVIELAKTIEAGIIWKNDLMNLQFLCMSCNTSKNDGALTFTAAPLGNML